MCKIIIATKGDLLRDIIQENNISSSVSNCEFLIINGIISDEFDNCFSIDECITKTTIIKLGRKKAYKIVVKDFEDIYNSARDSLLKFENKEYSECALFDDLYRFFGFYDDDDDN